MKIGEIKKKLGRKIGLLTYNSIHSLSKDRVLKDEKIIYQKE